MLKLVHELTFDMLFLGNNEKQTKRSYQRTEPTK